MKIDKDAYIEILQNELKDAKEMITELTADISELRSFKYNSTRPAYLM